MKLASFQRIAESPAAPVRTGVVTANGLVDVSAVVAALEVAPVAPGAHNQGMVRLLAGGAAALQRVREAAARATPQDHLALADARLLAPIPRPGKVVAIGRNYADHAKESGVAAPEAPRIIFKLPSSVVGPGTTVSAPQVKKLDFEIELGVVMGRVAKDVGVEQALDHVAGYTVLNDLSAREFQFDVSPAATTFAKSMDGFCPLGPWIVTADELPDPQNLRLRTWLNGELMQDGNTHDMVHGVRQIVAYASRFMTLEPGDVIATGTPAGVGLGRNPPLWLKPGDRMALEIEGVGTLEHGIG
jgi:2-keto-4-pentenoate hydratase/2-oxohepta-3-ene-1,7-dioic acid hydratase in catechol pathway